MRMMHEQFPVVSEEYLDSGNVIYIYIKSLLTNVIITSTPQTCLGTLRNRN